MGYIRRNNMSVWACAAVPVPKVNRPNEFRLTNDYRPVNAVTVPIAGTGSDLTSSSENVAGAYGFAGFDMPSGFSQLPLADDSQGSMSFITDEGVWTPSRVPQGAMDPPLHFRNQMNVVRERGLKLSAVKSFLFRKEAKWCGRLFSGVGVRHDPERLSGLHQLPLPSTAADLQQFLCATGWMRDSLMDYSRVMQPLHDKLEAVLKVVGRTKRLAAGAAIPWTTADTNAFETARQLLTTSKTLHYPSQNASIATHRTEAGDWSSPK
ncbi:Hypothetical protein PHPALM_11167 [Phytophthora palmivora]|uniref:Pol protein n=1 Tax=Phytophthora palmivora TaxID=4796 RepID=A0A2P4Y2Z2_9STRA|nr:Hypothetical protein PHPALM_11167 [Phytophthora palmivora]